MIVKLKSWRRFLSSSICHRNMKSLYDWAPQLCLSSDACTSELWRAGCGDDGGNFGVKSCKNIWKGRPEPHSGAARPSSTITQPQLIRTDRLHNRRAFENFGFFLVYLWRFRGSVSILMCISYLKNHIFLLFSKRFPSHAVEVAITS